MPNDRRYPDASPDAVALAAWMRDRLERGLPDTVRKRDAYGKSDLDVMGSAMAHLTAGADAARGTEMACAFYALGKVARITAGDPTADTADSWWDLVVYAMFGLRLAEEGTL